MVLVLYAVTVFGTWHLDRITFPNKRYIWVLRASVENIVVFFSFSFWPWSIGMGLRISRQSRGTLCPS